MTDTVTDTAADNLLLRILLDPEARADPHPLYRELRERAPVLRSDAWETVRRSAARYIEHLRGTA